MGLRKSDIMACTAILVGAGAGFGLTSLFAHGQQDTGRDEMITLVKSSESPVVHRMRLHRSGHEPVHVMEIRREVRSRAHEVRARAHEIRTEVRTSKAFALKEALSSIEGLEALEEAMEGLDFDFDFDFDVDPDHEFDGDMTIDVQFGNADAEHHKKKRKRRIIVKRPDRGGSGN